LLGTPLPARGLPFLRKPTSVRRATLGQPVVHTPTSKVQNGHLGSEVPQDTTRIPCSDNVCGEVSRDHTPRPDYGVFSNRYTRTDDGATAKPDPIANRDRERIL
jgi:hypothetical protein